MVVVVTQFVSMGKVLASELTTETSSVFSNCFGVLRLFGSIPLWLPNFDRLIGTNFEGQPNDILSGCPLWWEGCNWGVWSSLHSGWRGQNPLLAKNGHGSTEILWRVGW